MAEGQDHADGPGARLSSATRRSAGERGARQIAGERGARRIAGERGARRIEIVDALRAFALAGILQVNIQSFVWGTGDPLGYFASPPTALDAFVHVAIGTLVSIKFMSIFAFLFGVGFALQWRALKRRAATIAIARYAYRRRLLFLLALGLAHGVLLYHGDILAFYALAGFVLLLLAAEARAARLAASVRAAWWLFAGWSAAWLALTEAARLATPADDAAQVPASALARFALYTHGSYADQLAARVGDYAEVLLSMIGFATPQIAALFLLGALAGRLGWLAHPERHRRVWRAATWIGLAAVPFSALGAWLNFVAMRDAPGDPGSIGYALQLAGSPMACLYVALFVRWRARLAHAIAWLAPAGRMPLTNYLAQSAAMALALSGWGFGLGAMLSRAELALAALAIVALQLVASRAWVARFGQGPLEAAWRAWTYRGLSAASTFSHTPR